MNQFHGFPIPDEPQYVRITPKIAEDWAARNHPKNRTFSLPVAAKYAQIMTEGRWLTTHQGIAFDEDGYMIDGYHRMRAIMMTGVPITMYVHPKCSFDTFSVLDSGYKRNAAQLMRVPYASTVAASARVIAAVKEGYGKGGSYAVYVNSIETDELLAIVEKWPELITFAPLTAVVHTACNVSRTMHTAVMAMASRTKYADHIDPWLDGMATGAGFSITDPRLHLRNRWARDAGYLNSAWQRVNAFNLIVRAWNNYAQDREMQQLKAPREEEGVLTVVE